MSEYNIEKADFEKHKNELKEFSERPATSAELETFNTKGGPFGWFDHNVTGAEINELVLQLQRCFLEINERDKNVIREFGQVYETFEALDNEYIKGILTGIKSAEKASQEAKDAQKDIDDTIDALQKTIEKLKEFKDEINNYTHIKEIDSIWNDVKQCDKKIDDILKELERIKTKFKKREHYTNLDSLNTKLRIVFIIAIGAIAVSVSHIILSLTGIL